MAHTGRVFKLSFGSVRCSGPAAARLLVDNQPAGNASRAVLGALRNPHILIPSNLLSEPFGYGWLPPARLHLHSCLAPFTADLGRLHANRRCVDPRSRRSSKDVALHGGNRAAKGSGQTADPSWGPPDYPNG